eukprot:GFUD01088813.1.p1 GENE.GFUD01088813.1~~GFUD01088813.1.p1  ORF type:complete len:154 (+),score=23.23 GFUD01088813.1:82-543(+)
MLLFMTICLLSLVSGLAVEHQENTPAWADVCGGSFLFSEDTKTWHDAVGNCELYGSHLAQIDTMEKNFCLLEYAHIQEITVAFWWHSGNDLDSEGVYRQFDGKLLQWQPIWYSDDPNGSTGQNCLAVGLDVSAYSGKWIDNGCTNLYNYICER